MQASYQEASAKYRYELTAQSFKNLQQITGEEVKVNFTEQGHNKEKIGILKSVIPFTSITLTDGDVLYFLDRNMAIRSIEDKDGDLVYDKLDIIPKYFVMQNDLSKYRAAIFGTDSKPVQKEMNT